MALITPFFTNKTVDASDTATSANIVETKNAPKVKLYVKNTGDSTNVSIYFKGSDKKTKSMEETLWVCTLDASEKAGIGIDQSQIPEYVWAEIVNNDDANSAIISAEIVFW